MESPIIANWATDVFGEVMVKFMFVARVDNLVWKNFSILSPELVLEYAEDILSDSRLKNCTKCKGG